MSPHDPEIPEDDAVAGAARRALQRLAGDAALGDSSWQSVQAGARRVRQRRVTAVAAACAILLVGAGSAAAVVGSRNTGPTKPVASDHPTTTSTSAPTTTTTTPIPPATDPTAVTPPAGTIGTPPPVQTQTPTTTKPATGDAPQAGDFSGTMVVGSATTPQPVDVGGQVDIATIIRNISDHAILPASSTTRTALATVCTGPSNGAEHPGNQALWWMTNAPMSPGDTDGRTGTFNPDASFQGPVVCELDVVTTDPPVATFGTNNGGDLANARIIAQVAGVPAVTLQVVPTTWTVTTAGTVGPLTFGVSAEADLLADVGTPDVTTQGTFGVPTFPAYEALGYDCTDQASANRLPLHVQPAVAGPYCATIFYVNTDTLTLAGFQTTSARYATAKGTTAGMTSAQAAQREGVAVQPGACHPSGIMLGAQANQQSPGVIYLYAGTNTTDPVTEIAAEDQLVQVGVLFC